MSEHEIAKSEEPKAIAKPEIVDDQFLTEQLVDDLEKQVKLRDRVKIIALKATRTSDWVDEAGTPYLQATGAEKVAAMVGIKITGVMCADARRKDDKGEYIEYVYTGQAEIRKGSYEHSLEVRGRSWSRDPFFGQRTVYKTVPKGTPESFPSKNNDGTYVLKVKTFKPLSEVDLPSVRQKGYTNFLNNAIKRLLGIRGITWEDLEQAGLDTEKIRREHGVKYRTPKQTPAKAPQKPPASKPPQEAPKAQQGAPASAPEWPRADDIPEDLIIEKCKEACAAFGATRGQDATEVMKELSSFEADGRQIQARSWQQLTKKGTRWAKSVYISARELLIGVKP